MVFTVYQIMLRHELALLIDGGVVEKRETKGVG